MIIQCEQCETKFRFDESRIPPAGIWVRCSRCRHEFFLPHPEAKPPAEEELAIPDIRIDDHKPIPEVLPGSEPPPADKQAGIAEGEGEGEGNEKEPPAEKETTRTPLTVLYLLIAAVLLGSLGIWVLPDVRQKAMKVLAPYVLAIERMLGTDPSKKQSGLEGIQFQSVRQRFADNAIVGRIRVIEGEVFNQSEVPFTRIRVKAELADASDAVVAQRQSYTGNILTDDELTVMPDEGIQQRLSYAQGSPVSNDRVPPGGQIPFMIVVTTEPPGVANVYLSVAGAERLLQ